MKQLPEVNASFADLYGILIAPIQSLLLLTGIELGVFNHLSEPESADAAAKAIGSHQENTRLFLDGLAACDLITKKDGTYRNTPIAQEFLAEGSQTFMGPMLTIIAQTFFAINDLPKLVREGPPSSPELNIASGEMWAQFAASMANSERAGAAWQAVRIVSDLPEFPTLTKMLDLGGGPGGVFISCSEGLTDERTKPDNCMLSMIPMSLMGQDMCFDQGDIADSMLRVGFRSVRSSTLALDWGPMDLDIGRKA